MARNTFRSDSGVEVVELALLLPTLIIICFGIVDLLRLSYCESMLNRTATEIAVRARSAPNLDYDLREFTSDSGEYYDFREARSRAIAAGLKSAATSFSQPGEPSDAMLISATQLDDSLGNYSAPTPVPFAAAATILRPGEQATFSFVDSSGNTVSEIVTNPSIPAAADGKVSPQKMATLLDLSPIHVEVHALVHPILYFVLGDRVVRGRVTTYREKGIRRIAMVDDAGNDVAPATATRRTGTGEVWLTSPEPVEPVVMCSPAPFTWAQQWGLAFGQSSPPDVVVLDTTQSGGMCPQMWLAGSSSPMGL